MSSLTPRTPWEREVQRHFPSLSAAQGRVPGQWSSGIVLSNGCGITRVSHGLAKRVCCPVGRLRQRVRAWVWEARATRGKQRRDGRPRRGVFWGSVVRGDRGLERSEGVGAGHGCHDMGRTPDGVVHHCGDPWMCDPSRLAYPEGKRTGTLAAALAARAHQAEGKDPVGVERDRDDGSRAGCGLALVCDPGQWLASPDAGA